MRLIFTTLIASLLFTNFAFAAATSWNKNQSGGAQTQLIASFDEKDGKRKLVAAIHFKIASGWKIYGNDSGGIGLPPSLDFTNSKNYVKHEISWPEAKIGEEKIGKESLKYSYYDGEVIIPFAIELKKVDEPAELFLKLDYGLCKDVCIPASENFSLKIPAEIDAKVLSEIYPDVTQKPASEKPEKMDLSLFYAVLFALLGGAILNIMPCVLPVLSIKLISVINHSGAAISKIRFAFLSTIIGILSCFVIFAFLATLISVTGNSLGWGLQFQNPYFLIFLVTVLAFFTLNLLGIFEVSFSQVFATILNKKIADGEDKKNIFIPNFLSGILAVLLATPCSAPFLGSAISFAIVKDFFTILIIFSAIGIGFASPYIALLISPELVKYLPKPGLWMEKTKQLMAGFLVATIVWLIYVLSDNVGVLASIMVAIFCVAIFACFRIKNITLRVIALVAIISANFALPLDFQNADKNKIAAREALWRSFDEAELYQLVANGKTVLVDVTADWCITCKFNKIRVLHDKEILVRLGRGDIIGMRGDITKPNEEIMNFLHKHNRFAIPFNAVYGPNAKNGLLTSELLNTKELLELIKQASN